MHVLVAIAQFLVNEILSVPAFLIGIITAIGLVALRKSVGQIAGGAIKAVLGFLLIGAGATLVTASLTPLGEMIQGALGAQGVVPTNEAIAGIAQEQFGAQVSWLMILGFVVAILLARFTPLRYVFLTGHHLLFMATLITIVMASAGMPSPVVVILGAALLGVLMVSLPALAQPWTRRITGDESIAIGHFGTAGYIAAGSVGRLVDPKGRSRSTEDLKVPDSLRFLRDSMVATALSMVLMYVIVAVVYLVRAGEKTAFTAFEGGATNVGNYLMQSVTQGLQFGIAVAVILFGVRTILGELVPAFQGIAARVVPGAVPALDAPIVFPYAQNAVLIGFLSSFVGGLVGLLLLGTVFGPLFGLALILPGLVPHFFTGGAAGVYGNATGGRRGAVAGAFVNGLLVTFLPALLLKVLGTFGSANTTFGDTDFGWFGILIGYGARPGVLLGSVILAVIGLVILGAAITVQKRVVDRGWDPAPARASLVEAGAAGESATGASDGVDGSGSVAGGTAARYPRVAPPVGAPSPPPPPKS
ncbi:PTS ascorbate transporter subunit IIC [Brachybacterium halotolerans subsp. kimchii]|uniref:PTS ascorbate transporter subunit IIC n=1 Tax=Brachybacterium halotolerans TaxID=2795215 RepID=UPI001E3295D4|nr:PTS ascorbate transporter subunit IIC [Brachybacterium halotolerans]UEJ81556.1 PTS ascorbate transporter subunit IIC [Brachybacterium halotolerans subsp. kimchii]